MSEPAGLCSCGCGRPTRKGLPYVSDHANPCRCGCGGRARYAYAPGHRPDAECSRCGKEYAPIQNADDPGRCSQCRRHVRNGAPEQISDLAGKRKAQELAPPGKRFCHGCERYRALRFFGRSGSGYYARCKPCHKEQIRARMLPKVYSITLEQYEAIKAEQGGKCAICQVATGARRSLATDHDHACCSGKSSCGQCVRGVLCSTCNKMIGFGRDRPEFFQRAIEYLTSPPAHNVIPRRGETP